MRQHVSENPRPFAPAPLEQAVAGVVRRAVEGRVDQKTAVRLLLELMGREAQEAKLCPGELYALGCVDDLQD